MKTLARSNPRRSYRIRSVTFRVVREPGAPDPRELSTPSAVARLARDVIPDDGREHFVVFLLNASLRVLGVHEVSVGTADASLVSPRDVFGAALRVLGTVAIILCHSHPSGDPTPSKADVRLTRELVEAGKLLDLPVHDHVIVSHEGTYVSLAEHGDM